MSRDRRTSAHAEESPVAVVAIAASTLFRHLDDHPAVALSRVLRALPVLARHAAAAAAQRAGGRWAPLALDAAGRSEEAHAAIQALAKTERGRVPAAAAAYALHDMAAAQSVLASTETSTRNDRYARALCLRALGFLRKADACVEQDRGARARRLRRRLADQLEVLRPTGRPACDGEPRVARTTPMSTDGVVLHLVTNALPETQAGYTTRTQGIVRSLRDAGTDARVAPRVGFPVVDGRLRAPRTAVVGGVPYVRSLPLGLPRDAAGIVRLDADLRGRLARALDAQVLHAHSNYLNARAALSARDHSGTPVVYEVRGMLEETWRSRGGSPDADQYRLARASETEAMLAADAVVVISEVLREEVVGRGVAEGRVVLVPNAVDNRFLDEPPDATALRRDLGIAETDVVVGTVSTLNDYEGLDVLIKATSLARAQGVAIRLLIVGSGPAEGELRRRAATLGRGIATLTGRVPFADVHRYHAAIDIFTVPRLALPVTALVPPIKPLEAMATGRPVVASDLPPLREIVTHERGELTPAGDAEALAAALAGLAEDPDRRARLGRQAQEFVRSERTWARAAEHYQALYGALTDM